MQLYWPRAGILGFELNAAEDLMYLCTETTMRSYVFLSFFVGVQLDAQR